MNLQMFILAIIVPLVILALALYTLFKSKKGMLSASFAVLCIHLTLVITVQTFLTAPFIADKLSVFVLFSFLGILTLIPVALFFKVFPEKDTYSRFYDFFILALIIPFGIFFYLLFTGQWVHSVSFENTILTINYQNDLIATAWGAAVVILMMLIFVPIGLRFRYISGTDRTRLRLMLTGLGISAIMSAGVALLSFSDPRFSHLTWLYPFTFVPFLSTTIYSIVRYRFMETRLAIRAIIIKTTHAIVMATTAILLYVLNVYIFGEFNMLLGAAEVVFSAILFVTTYDLLLNGLQFLYDGYFFPQLKNKEELHEELLKVTTESIDLSYITDRVSGITKEMFGTEFSRVLLETDEEFAMAFVDEQEGITVLDELLHKSQPTHHEEQTRDYLTEAHIQLNIPLLSHAGIIAVLQLGEKKNNEAYTSDEISLLSALQRHLGIALENAQLFYELANDKETIKEEHAKLDVVLSNIVDAVAALDDSGTILFVNKAMLELTAKDEATIVGAQFNDQISLIYNEQPLKYEQIFPKEQTEHASVYTYPEPVELQNNGYQKCFVKVTGAYIRQSASTEISQIIMFHDVTKEIQLETMKLDFVSMAAHELRTPLTSIRGYTEMAQREIEDKSNNTEDMHVFLERIMINASELNTLVDNLLNVSQIEQGSLSIHPRPTEIPKLISSLLPDFESLAAAREQTFVYEKPESLPVVLADRAKLAEVYQNIVTNALKYTPTHGKITLRVWHDEHFIYSSVKDDGPGISDDALPYMFTKFFRVQGPLEAGSKGTGLGLYISKSIVTLHGGDIWVESAVGKGSTFTFTLPWSKTTPTPAPEEYMNEPTVKHLIRLKSKE